MNTRQKKTLALIFEKPTRNGLRYDDLKSLLISVGANIREGRGSRVRFEWDAYSLHIHAPHPQKVLPKYSIELIRDFLVQIGVKL
ncbi:MAG: hypothetical protein CVU54_18760 [Deltaproteobacteria bacterium HGW-Deltaproteobacteria-12]|jgi:hypothetical protein|nr:MAG: hypothetical protein CVU54_18760 [Deltaproteobacteria bacterium HGW-Deltaproteobacteria-12]